MDAVKINKDIFVETVNNHHWGGVKNLMKLAVALISAGLVIVACRVTSSEEGSANTVHSAKFEDGEFSGWNADDSKFPNGFVKFNSSDMVNLVNGGAADYVAKGMSEGFQQDMAKGDLTYRSWVMDFGTEANAKEMYNSQIQQLASVKEAAGSYPETVAFLEQKLYGYDGYAVFGKYMVVIWLDGYGSNKSRLKKCS